MREIMDIIVAAFHLHARYHYLPNRNTLVRRSVSEARSGDTSRGHGAMRRAIRRRARWCVLARRLVRSEPLQRDYKERTAEYRRSVIDIDG
jgi:hypothetical protein